MPTRPGLSLVLLAVLASSPAGAAPEGVAGLRVPLGFEASEFAGSDLANDIQCMTIDPDGRVIVSGRGYIRVLVDDDDDGRADRALPFADGPAEGAMGLLREGDSLFIVGGGGLLRYTDADGDDRADGPPEQIRAMKAGGEHDAHAVRRGPDGWLYVIIGNFAGVDAAFASLPTSPIADPVAGCLVRLAPDLGGSEIVADGFRNAYDFDFGPDGEAFAYDSDNERCVSLPWYEPTRLYHVVPGGHHGWLAPQRTETWRLPPEVEDVVPPAAAIDRGSPTGVACYRHDSFPARYRDGLFLLDWTFGRVYFASPRRSGASYAADPEVFMEATGEQGFAWTDVEVHPTSGELYFSIGGRGTRGAVYRVRYVGEDGGEKTSRRDAETQRRGEDVPGSLHSSLRLRVSARDPVSPPHDLPPGAIDPAIPTERILAASESPDTLQRLRALVELKRRRREVPPDDLVRAIQSNWHLPDRRLRMASADLIAGLEPDQLEPLVSEARGGWRQTTLGFGLADREPGAALMFASSVLGEARSTDEHRLAATRLVQVALGGQPDPRLKGTVWEGYSAGRDRSTFDRPSRFAEIAGDLRGGFPFGLAALDRERTRTLAIIEDDDPASVRLVASRLTESSDPIDDLHHLIVLGRLRAPRTAEITDRVADALIAIDRKLDDRAARRDRNWPLRVAELYDGLAGRDPALHDALLAHPEFGRPDHALFALADGFDRIAAARFLDRAEADPDFAWNAEVVSLVGRLGGERSRAALRPLWGRQGLDEAILPHLARDPIPEDRPKFVAGLRSSQPSTRDAALDALDTLGPADDPGERLALVLALRRAAEDGERHRIAAMLGRSTGQDLGDDPSAWADWFAVAYPDRAGVLDGGDGVDLAAWGRRLAAIDWAEGDAGRGRDVFNRTQCAACHSGNRAVGPDLSGVTGRFSRDDLFDAILQPSRDVADRYRSVLVGTADGGIHQGIPIYDAVDSLILQAGPTETVLIRPDDVEERRASDLSLMPAGLLDEASDREIADLDAFLRSLGSPAAASDDLGRDARRDP